MSMTKTDLIRIAGSSWVNHPTLGGMRYYEWRINQLMDRLGEKTGIAIKLPHIMGSFLRPSYSDRTEMYIIGNDRGSASAYLYRERGEESVRAGFKTNLLYKIFDMKDYRYSLEMQKVKSISPPPETNELSPFLEVKFGTEDDNSMNDFRIPISHSGNNGLTLRIVYREEDRHNQTAELIHDFHNNQKSLVKLQQSLEYNWEISNDRLPMAKPISV